ncbi:Glyoxylase, beta-lactamase superfamily II [Nannocystis exedens]|uniref:Glyoxylase, beta-lactamase superfamily II n=1 Tax=Nannocystis exedens TaxID=54 RepID=A0A1I1ZEZ0_9BACT|nr:MBL fold metallo-hydrolase [Nannocystis exedens]PCC75019.1 MBL fold metallo-hydrolase [Nannocystis exedens]SFE29898.1 Glyoxylase, beta-lactamase superfamily II [Nannocystis exedens]
MKIEHFYDARTNTLSYLVYDERTRDALVIDPVLDYEPVGSKVWEESVGAIAARIGALDLRLGLLLETHAHADHLSGSQVLKRRFPGVPLAIGAAITEVQAVFRDIYDLGPEFRVDGSQFDRLLHDGERFAVGALHVEAIATPGHTPACMSYRIGDAVFVGDAMFMPDYGAGRCDFPAGSARALWRSITRRLYTLPDDTRMFVCHDYQPGGRPLAWQTTIGEQKADNVQLPAGREEDDFVAFRTARDATLDAPKLLYPSVQVNIDGGRLPRPAPNGRSYLKIPLDIRES